MKSKTNLTSNARLNTWYDTDTKEIKTFLGMTIGMGLVQQMSLNDYWSTDKILSTPFFPTIMPRNRFLGILSCLHLNNNEKHVARDHTEYDPIFKLRPVYDVMQTKFRESYTVPCRCSEGFLFRRFIVPKVRWSEGSLIRRFKLPGNSNTFLLCSWHLKFEHNVFNTEFYFEIKSYQMFYF